MDAAEWRKAADSFRRRLDLLYNPAGYYRKGYLLNTDGKIEPDDTIDISSLYGLFMFASVPLDDTKLQSTFKMVSSILLNSSPIGGVIRYEHDNYFLQKQQYKGNPWIVCSLWLAQYYIATQRNDEAKQLLDWALARRLPSGMLSEQFDPDNGQPISVTPLVWSHSELINTLLDYYKL